MKEREIVSSPTFLYSEQPYLKFGVNVNIFSQFSFSRNWWEKLFAKTYFLTLSLTNFRTKTLKSIIFEFLSVFKLYTMF